MSPTRFPSTTCRTILKAIVMPLIRPSILSNTISDSSYQRGGNPLIRKTICPALNGWPGGKGLKPFPQLGKPFRTIERIQKQGDLNQGGLS